jgi:hypothetical protein
MPPKPWRALCLLQHSVRRLGMRHRQYVLRRPANRLDNIDIAGATAQVACQCLLDLLVRRVWMCRQQRRCRAGALSTGQKLVQEAGLRVSTMID